MHGIWSHQVFITERVPRAESQYNKVWYRADFRLAPSQWETSLQSNAVSHWLGANLESALWYIVCSNAIIMLINEDHWVHFELTKDTHTSPSLGWAMGCLMYFLPLQWSHNEHVSASNHLRLNCLLNCWFRRRSRKASKLRVTGLCTGNSSVTHVFPEQKANNIENVSIWWLHHDNFVIMGSQWE